MNGLSKILEGETAEQEEARLKKSYRFRGINSGGKGKKAVDQ